MLTTQAKTFENFLLLKNEPVLNELVSTFKLRVKVRKNRETKDLWDSVDKIFYYKFIETYKSMQKNSLNDLSEYAVLANNIFQQEIHQNIDLLNFSNQLTFSKAYKVTGV